MLNTPSWKSAIPISMSPPARHMPQVIRMTVSNSNAAADRTGCWSSQPPRQAASSASITAGGGCQVSAVNAARPPSGQYGNERPEATEIADPTASSTAPRARRRPGGCRRNG